MHVKQRAAMAKTGSDQSIIGSGTHQDKPKNEQPTLLTGANEGKKEADNKNVNLAADNKEGPTSSDHQGNVAATGAPKTPEQAPRSRSRSRGIYFSNVLVKMYSFLHYFECVRICLHMI
jgi:hypothetical protein